VITRENEDSFTVLRGIMDEKKARQSKEGGVTVFVRVESLA